MTYFFKIISDCLLYSSVSISQNLLTGFSGISTIHLGAVMGIGAYSYALIIQQYGAPPLSALLLASVISGVFSMGCSLLIQRLKGDGLVLISFALAIITSDVITNWKSLTAGPRGIIGIPSLWSTVDYTRQSLADSFIAGTLLIIIIMVSFFLTSRRYGLILKSTRENSTVTAANGHYTKSYVFSIFIVSGLITGLCGALLASFLGVINPNTFNEHLSLQIFIMAICGGLGSLKGSIFGAFLLIALPESLRFLGVDSQILGQVQQIAFGMALMLTLFFKPKGILGTYQL